MTSIVQYAYCQKRKMFRLSNRTEPDDLRLNRQIQDQNPNAMYKHHRDPNHVRGLYADKHQKGKDKKNGSNERKKRLANTHPEGLCKAAFRGTGGSRVILALATALRDKLH